MASFGPIAPYYDELMSEVPYDMWASYYMLLLEQIEAKPKTLLDVCCGTGCVAERLAPHGYKVTGVDISRPMIAQAKKKSKGVEYIVADVTRMDLGRKFDAAYSFFDSLNYITDPNRLASAFQCVAKHLRRGGSLIFDLNTAYAFEQRMFDQQDMRRKTRLKYKWRGRYSARTRVIKVDMRFWLDEKEFREEHVQRAHPDEEVREYLDAAGFDLAHVYESYTLDRPRKTSDRLHYVAVKRKG